MPQPGPTAPLPSHSLLAWFPYLWSRVLFPGPAPVRAPVRWQAVALLLLLPGALLYPCLAFRLFEPDEGRYAEIPREMFQRGEWVVPVLGGEPYLDKPPLVYWLVMVSYRVFGVHDWAARLVPALAVHASVLLTYLLGRRMLGERAAFWGALLLALAPGFVSVGRLLVLDGVLALFVWLAVLTAFEALRGDRLRRGWWLTSAAACGLGVLTKGPIGLLLLVPPLIAYRLLGQRLAPVSWRAAASFLVVVLALNVPWYVAVCARTPEFAGYFFWKHNILRFLQPFDHLEPVWYYLPILFGGLLPATLLAWPFLRFLLSGDELDAARRCPELGFLLLAGSWCVFFFSLSGSKLPTYILPAFPPLALALGCFLARSRWRRSSWTKLALGLAIVFQFAGHYLLVPWYAAYRSPLGQWEQLAGACADRDTPVLCYPRSAHAVAFYLGRADLRNFRSKQIDEFREELRRHPRTVVLLTHRHSLHGLRQALPPDLHITHTTHFGLAPFAGLPDGLNRRLITGLGETALGLCDLAVIERRSEGQGADGE